MESWLYQAFSEVQNPAQAAHAALNCAIAVMGTRLGNVQLIDWSISSSLQIVVHQGFKPDFLSRFEHVTDLDSTVCGRALRRRSPVVVGDILEDDGFAPYRDAGLKAGFRAVQSVPLLSPRGALFGVLSTHCAEPGTPEDSQLEKLRIIAWHAAVAMVRIRTAERAAKLDLPMP